MRNFAKFIARVLTSKNKELFTIRLGVSLTLKRFGISGPLAEYFVGGFFRGLLGVLVEDGVFLIDISLDAYREGEKLKDFKAEAIKAYAKARKKVYTNEEKNKIRAEYRAIIAKFNSFK